MRVKGNSACHIVCMPFIAMAWFIFLFGSVSSVTVGFLSLSPEHLLGVFSEVQGLTEHLQAWLWWLG